MKKYLLLLPIVALIAAGCSSTNQSETDSLMNESVVTNEPATTDTTPANSASNTNTKPQPATNTQPTPAPKPVEEAPKTEPVPNTYTLAQVQAANSKDNCWSIVSGNVYNLTAWIDKHPGGSRSILNMCGKDATDAFVKQHGGQKNAQNALAQYKLGPLSN